MKLLEAFKLVKIKTLLLSVMVLFSFNIPLLAQSEGSGNPIVQGGGVSLPSIIDARVFSTTERARLVLDLSDKTKFALASFVGQDSSNRIAVDIKASKVEFADKISPSGAGVITSVSIEEAEVGRIRIWLSLGGFAQVQQAYILESFEGQPARLVVDIVQTSEEIFKQNAANDIAFSNGLKNNQANLGDHSTAPGELNVEITSKAFIVIDPGHGGVDNGATANNGAKEKDIVLEFAKELQGLLVQSGAFEVALTRSDDSFLRLNERVDVARLNKADLFISLHADSFGQDNVGGASIYTRDEEATDVLDKVLADNENMSDIIAGFSPANIDKHAVSVLVDLMRREMRKKSFQAATAIIAQLEPSVKLRRYPIRKADFFVLQSPDVPSILIELGFLSNVSDAENLITKEWRVRVSQAIARGIAVYFDN